MVSSLDYERSIPHYERREAQEEIAKFSRDRWVALHCETVTQGDDHACCDINELERSRLR